MQDYTEIYLLAKSATSSTKKNSPCCTARAVKFVSIK